MTFVSVWVERPRNRLIYINGDYSQHAGNSSDGSFTVPAGGQIFETLNSSRQVDNRKRFRVRRNDPEVRIELEPVSPPEAV